MTAAWDRYCEMASDRELRDHLGLSSEEWNDQPAEFVDWARDFLELQRKVGRQ